MTDDTRRTIDRYAAVGTREHARAGWQTWVDRLQRLLTLFADDSGPGAGIPAVPDPDVTNRKNMALLIQLRSIAIVGQIVPTSEERRVGKECVSTCQSWLSR